ncbi:unnamed protein product [Rotaria sp. Silwood1]|nr:unnamed protein product [Rotaria sp. Silwood1]
MSWFKFVRCAGWYLNTCPGRQLKVQYDEMKTANCMNCDKFFHCQGNYNAVHVCGKTTINIRIAKKISDCREAAQDASSVDSQEDQKANKFGREGGNCSAEYLCKANCKYNPRNKSCQRTNCP